MRILCTGGAGYLGSVLVPQLINRGHVVTVIDSFKYGVPSLSNMCRYPEFSLINADVRNQSVLQEQLKKADAVIPLAAIVGAPACARIPQEATSINYQAVKYLVKSCSKDQVIVFPNTNSGYGTTEAGTVCTEETPSNPISVYGRTKQDAENEVLQHESGIALRFATLFGVSPRMRLDLLVNDFVYRAMNDRSIVLFESHFRRNFLHVRDAAQAIMFCLDNVKNMHGQTFNAGNSAANLTKKELCDKIKKHVPSLEVYESATGKDPDQRDYIVSNAKIEELGWKARLSIDDGIIELLSCYQQPFHLLQNRNI